jgi:cell division septum initiation protein DivIVA
MEAKLRTKHDEEREWLRQQQEACAKFSAKVKRSRDEFNSEGWSRMLQEKQKAQNEVEQLSAKIEACDRRCAYFAGR